MMFWIILFMMSSNAFADIFSADPQDMGITSAYKTPYEFKNNNVRPMISWEMDRNKEIAEAVNQLSRANINKHMQLSPLLLWEYSAPAEADIYKHFQTLAYLRLAMDQQRLKELEYNESPDMSALRQQAIYDCIKEKYFVRHEFANDIAGLLDSCKGKAAFHGLKLGQGGNVFEKLFNRYNLRGERRNRILSMLPVWEIDRTSIHVTGPSKRIGQVVQENRIIARDRIKSILDLYQRQRTTERQDLEALSLPNRPFTDLDVLFLLSLPSKERTTHIEKIIQSLSYYQALGQYNEGIEWLKRYRDHPEVEEGYKNIIRKGIEFLEAEKSSLAELMPNLKSYAASLDTMLTDSKTDQLNLLKQSKDREQFKIWLGL